jgi:hypothetical protein
MTFPTESQQRQPSSSSYFSTDNSPKIPMNPEKVSLCKDACRFGEGGVKEERNSREGRKGK